MLNFLRSSLLISVLMTAVSHLTCASQLSVGWLEEVTVGGSGFQIEAKIDTGADNSSINAVNPKIYSKNGGDWVKFKLENDHGRELIIDKPIIDRVKVKTKSKGVQERIVIELQICLASIKKRVPVNLIDRSHFKYQLLIGRSYLSPDFLVDASKEYSVGPKCR